MMLKFIFALNLLFLTPALWAENLITHSAHTTATLLAEKTSITPKTPFLVGLYLNTETGWHTYANPPGEAGLPTEIEWQLPPGFTAGPILWPPPHTFEDSGIIAYGYEGPILLPILITPPNDLKPHQPITLQATVRWLECNTLCLPGGGSVSLTLPIATPGNTPTLNPQTSILFQSLLATSTTAPAEQKAPFSLLLIFGWAFLGGLILNLMPCVFPVLGLKVMSFVSHAHESRRGARAQGLIFTLGILVSFWALSGLLIALRAQGEALGWGFQLQSPGFVIFLITLLFTLGLVFLGVFEIGMGLSGAGSGLTSKKGAWGAFFSGILATLVATPCTAPFMGVALGFALSQPAWMALCIFTALAIGMASPYLVLSFFPGLLKFLPRPGAWMESFKEAMAFPLFATVVWLLWVFGLQTQIGAVAEVLFGLVLVGLLCWIYGRWGAFHQSLKTRRIAYLLSGLFATGALFLFTQAARTPSNSTPLPAAQSDIPWEPFSPERLAALRAKGQPVFIDFTAAWCLTCQANLRGALSNPEVIQAIQDKSITPLIADWTRRDPIITQALADIGRSGVPTYALYPAHSINGPIILPEVLTVDLLLEAFNAL